MINNSIIKIAIADDHQLFRKGMVSVLNSYANFEVVFEASNGQEMVDQLENTNVDIVLMDLKMPVLDGIKATEIIKSRYPKVKVVVVSMYDEDQFVIKLMELGANGYLLKDTDPDEVELALNTIFNEDYYYGAFLNKVMHRKMVDNNNTKRKPVEFAVNVTLTDREKEIIRYVCEGMKTNEIADKVCLSPRTVEGHRNNIMEKIGAKNLAGIVVYGIKHNIYE